MPSFDGMHYTPKLKALIIWYNHCKTLLISINQSNEQNFVLEQRSEQKNHDFIPSILNKRKDFFF
jgi:hypothetical protein